MNKFKYDTIMIPVEVLNNYKLKANEYFLFGIIYTCVYHESACDLTNVQLANILDVDERSIQNYMTTLRSALLVQSHKVGNRRHINLVEYFIKDTKVNEVSVKDFLKGLEEFNFN